MKTSEIKSLAVGVLNTVYKYVLKSDDKEQWKKAIESIDKRIYSIRMKRNRLIIKNDELSRQTIIELWIWESAKKQFIKKFAKKFI